MITQEQKQKQKLKVERLLLNNNARTNFEYRKDGIYLINRRTGYLNLTFHYMENEEGVLDTLDRILDEDIPYKTKFVIYQVIDDLREGYY